LQIKALEQDISLNPTCQMNVASQAGPRKAKEGKDPVDVWGESSQPPGMLPFFSWSKSCTFSPLHIECTSQRMTTACMCAKHALVWGLHERFMQGCVQAAACVHTQFAHIISASSAPICMKTSLDLEKQVIPQRWQEAGESKYACAIQHFTFI